MSSNPRKPETLPAAGEAEDQTAPAQWVDRAGKLDRYAESTRLHTIAASVMPGGVSSDVRRGGYPVPLTFTHGAGARLYDVDGNEYIDYAMGMGPNILGHAAGAVTRQVKAVLEDGQLYAGQHRDEIELAQLLVELIPCAERVRFSSSGSEAVQAAMRLARAATGRNRVVKFTGHYHGWFDNIFAERCERGLSADMRQRARPMSTGQSHMALDDVDVLPWNDYPTLEAYVQGGPEDIAAIIMEPIPCNTAVILPTPGYLEQVRALCDKYGVVLIFDEVITGFRVALGGAQELLGIRPDVAVYAKAMGNGFPISAVVGKAAVLDHAIGGSVHAGTYNANRTSVAAALATLKVLSARGRQAYQDMNTLGSKLVSGIERLALGSRLPLRTQGLGAVFHTYFGPMAIRCAEDAVDTDPTLLRNFLEVLQDKGVRPTARGTWFMSLAHTEADINQTLYTVGSALEVIEEAGGLGPRSGGC